MTLFSLIFGGYGVEHNWQGLSIHCQWWNPRTSMVNVRARVIWSKA